jgi:hypothetical protein
MNLHTPPPCVNKPTTRRQAPTKPHPADAPAFHPLPDSLQVALDLGTLALVSVLALEPALGQNLTHDSEAAREMMALGLAYTDPDNAIVLTPWGRAVCEAYRKGQGSAIVRLSPNLSTFHTSNNGSNNDPSNNGSPAPIQPAVPKIKPQKPTPAPVPAKPAPALINT